MFDLAKKLAENHEKVKEINEIKIYIDNDTLISIFFLLLNSYTYEELLNPKNVKHITYFDGKISYELKTLSDYIDRLIYNIYLHSKPNYPEIIKFLNNELQDKINNLENECDILITADEKMTDDYPELVSTISWKKNIKLYEQYIEKELSK